MIDMQYQLVTDSADCLITILPSSRGAGFIAGMLCIAPTTVGDTLFTKSIYPAFYKGSTKEGAVQFFESRIRLGAKILKAGWVGD